MIMESEELVQSFISHLKPNNRSDEIIIEQIKNERKVLKITKERKPKFQYLLSNNMDLKTYNETFAHTSNEKLTQEEFELLRKFYK